ncbi:MAG: T9SS type A sorting domain-containing protein [Melioribacter sp.]|nr:T9SS type A sorting domain-containing protein [Melioribacter sp.]
MSKLKLVILFVLFYTSAKFQNIGDWKIHANMKDIKKAITTTNGVWTVSNGGAFRLNPSADTSFFVLNKANGLITQTLTAIGVDKQNKIWFGSQEGYIIVYNQSSNSISNILDIYKSSKLRKKINDFYFSNDTAFVSTDFGLTLINTNNLTFYDTFLKLGSFPTESRVLNTFRSGLVYSITENGVAIQKPGSTNLSAPESWNSYSFSSNISVLTASKILLYNNQIVLGTNDGIYRFQNNSWQPFILQGNIIKDISISGTSLLAITDKKLIEYNGSQTNQLFENQSISLTSISVTENKVYYISSNNGLIEIKNNVTKYLAPQGPFSNLFMNLSVAGNSNLYVGTGKDLFGIGFLEFDRKSWKRYSRESSPQLPSNAYHNVFAADDNSVYLSNWGYGFAIFKNGQLEVYTASNSELVGIPINNNFLAIADIKVDSKKNIWIANHQSAARKQLSVLTPDKKWYHFSMTNPYLSEFDVLDKMVIDQNGTKWFVVMEGNRGLYYYNEKETYTNLNDDTQGGIRQSDGLFSDVLTSLAIDKRGYLWIGTSAGINVITDPSKPLSTLRSNFAPSLKNQSVTCIAIDALDQKWIGTKQGVAVISSDGITLLAFYDSKNSPIPNDEIRSIAVDEKLGKVYIGTDYGLAELQTYSMKPVESFNELFVYPNPIVITGNEENQITIDGLIKNSRIKVFDISGNLIRDFISPGGKIAFWDLKDLNGRYVSSGVYVIVAYDEEANNVATSKVAVIRK